MDEYARNRRVGYVEWIIRDLESRIKMYEHTLIGLDNPDSKKYIQGLLNKNKRWLKDYQTELMSLLEQSHV